MRIKKGFTLAEILIVLMVLGAIATMTIPSLMKGVQEAQFKTAYKKATNAIVNLMAMEKMSGNLPSLPGRLDRMFDILNSSLSVKAYVGSRNTRAGNQGATTLAISSGETIAAAGYLPEPFSANGANAVEATETQSAQAAQPAVGRSENWIITDDNIAYIVAAGGFEGENNAKCPTKAEILSTQTNVTTSGEFADTVITDTSAQSDDPAAANACYIVYVDVNGLTAGPNRLSSAGNSLANNETIPTITNDIFPIYIGLDGATAGNQTTTITGRINADMK